MTGTQKTLTHPQVGILAARGYRTCLLLISRLNTYRLISVRGICDKVTTIFRPDNGIYYFFNSVHRVLKLDSLIIEQNIGMHHS